MQCTKCEKHEGLFGFATDSYCAECFVPIWNEIQAASIPLLPSVLSSMGVPVTEEGDSDDHVGIRPEELNSEMILTLMQMAGLGYRDGMSDGKEGRPEAIEILTKQMMSGSPDSNEAEVRQMVTDLLTSKSKSKDFLLKVREAETVPGLDS